jgi:ABC-2 type transport system permease protein
MSVVFELTVRQLARGKRPLVLLLVPLVPAVLALATRLSNSGQSETEVYATLMEDVFLPTAVAFTALVLGASALGDERDDGTILYLVSTPLARVRLAGTKALAAWLVTFTLCLPGLIACFILALDSQATISAGLWSLAALAGATAAYVAAFSALSMLTRRPVVIGFLYVVFWEGSIATVAPGADRFSIAAYARVLVARGLPADASSHVPDYSPLLASCVLVGVIAVATWLCTRRLSRAELP